MEKAYDAVGGAIARQEGTRDLRVEVAPAATAAVAPANSSVEPEALLLLAARERIASLLRQLLDVGYGSMSRKQMLCSSRDWTTGKHRPRPR